MWDGTKRGHKYAVCRVSKIDANKKIEARGRDGTLLRKVWQSVPQGEETDES